MGKRLLAMHVTHSPDATVAMFEPGYWHLEILASASRTYRLAQLDDHGDLPRHLFPWKPPLSFSLQARLSAENLPGTWGFGFWNEPFSFLLGGSRAIRRFPALPNAAWFFHASPENYLTFSDNLPACGFLAATFSSKMLHPAILALASPALGLALLPMTAQLLRRNLQRLIMQDSGSLQVDITAWHTFSLDWLSTQVIFRVDGTEHWRTAVAPPPPLSLVIWIDNQYASLAPRDRLRYGNLLYPSPAWLEVRDLDIQEHF